MLKQFSTTWLCACIVFIKLIYSIFSECIHAINLLFSMSSSSYLLVKIFICYGDTANCFTLLPVFTKSEPGGCLHQSNHSTCDEYQILIYKSDVLMYVLPNLV